MPIKSTQLPFRYTQNVIAGDPGGPSSSLGGWASVTAIRGGSLHNLFPQITAAQNKTGFTDYRCICVSNVHPTLTLSGLKVWISQLDTKGSAVAIGLDPLGAQVTASKIATAISSGTAAPSGVTFSTPTSKTGGLSVTSLAAGQSVAIWVRRATNNNAAANPENNVLSLSGTSPF